MQHDSYTSFGNALMRLSIARRAECIYASRASFGTVQFRTFSRLQVGEAVQFECIMQAMGPYGTALDFQQISRNQLTCPGRNAHQKSLKGHIRKAAVRL